MKRLLTILMTVLLLCSSVLSAKVIYAEEETDEELVPEPVQEVSEEEIDLSDEEDLAFTLKQSDKFLDPDQPLRIVSGQCGDNIEYSFDTSTYSLSIFGTGEMYDFESDGTSFYKTPWRSYAGMMKSVEIGEGVTSIGNGTFYGESLLVDVSLPNTLTRIGSNAFMNCRKLESINIPESVQEIGAYAFYDCNALSEITIPDGVDTIENSTFGSCNLSRISIPNSVETISDMAFSHCEKLEELTLHYGLKSIGSSAFSNSNLSSVKIPSSVSNIEQNAFSNSENLNEITFYHRENDPLNMSFIAFFQTWETETDVYVRDIDNINSSISNNDWSHCRRTINYHNIENYPEDEPLETVDYAYAILTAEGNLLFFRSDYIYENGQTYDVTINNEVYSGVVFTDFENTEFQSIYDPSSFYDSYTSPWFSYSSEIVSVDIADGYQIKPISTAYWFAQMKNLTSVDLNGMDTSDVTDMHYMFNRCSSLNTIDLSVLDTSNVENASGMFQTCIHLKNLSVGRFDSLKTMSQMFNNCALEAIDLSKFNTSQVTDMMGLFDMSSIRSLDLSNFDTHSAQNMNGMFAEMANLTSLDLSHLDTSNVTDMGYMFLGDFKLTSLDLSTFDTSSLEQMRGMFWDCSKLESLDLSSFNTENVFEMTKLFEGCSMLQEVKLGTGWTNWVSDAYLPAGTWTNGSLSKTEIELYNGYRSHRNEWAGTWSREITIAESMSLDKHTLNLKTGESEKLTVSFIPEDTSEKSVNWKSSDYSVAYADSDGTINTYKAGTAVITATTKDGSNLSDQCEVIVTDPASTDDVAYAILTDGTLLFFRSTGTYENGQTYDVTINGENYSGTVYAGIETTLYRQYYDEETESVVTINPPWYEDAASVIAVDIADGAIITPLSTFRFFAQMQNLTSVNLAGLNTSAVTNMAAMFSNCTSIEEIDLTQIDTSNAEDISNMFYFCRKLKTLTTGNFDSLRYMTATFNVCSSLNYIDLSKFCTANVLSMGSLFGFSGVKSLDLSDFDTQSATDMYGMFEACSGLTSLDLSNFDTSNVTTMAAIFGGCSNLTTLDLTSFDTSNVTDMRWMFENSAKLESIDLSSFNTINVTQMTEMFLNCPALCEVKLGSGWINWINDSYLTEGKWTNGSISLSETELYEQYPGHASEWAGTWVKEENQTDPEVPEGLQVTETEEGIKFYFDNPGQEEIDYLNNLLVAKEYNHYTGEIYQEGSYITISCPEDDSQYLNAANWHGSNPENDNTNYIEQIVFSEEGNYILIPREIIMTEGTLFTSQYSYNITVHARDYADEVYLELNGLQHGKTPFIDGFTVSVSIDDENNVYIRSNDENWLEAACKTIRYNDEHAEVEKGSYLFFQNTETGRETVFYNAYYEESDWTNLQYELRTDDSTSEKYIFISNDLLSQRLEAGTKYSFRFDTYGYPMYWTDENEEGGYIIYPNEEILPAPDDVEIIINEDRDIEIISSDDDWLEALVHGRISFVSDSFAVDGPMNLVSLLDGKVLYKKDIIIQCSLTDGTYEMHMRADGYETLCKSVEISGYVKRLTDELTVSGENGELVITCNDSDYLNALTKSYVWEYGNDVPTQTAYGSQINLYYPEGPESIYLNCKWINHDTGVTEEENYVTVSGNQAIITNEKLLTDENVHDCEGIHVYLHAYGYEDIDIYDVSLKGVKNNDPLKEPTSDVSIWYDEGLIIECEDTDFLDALATEYVYRGEIAQTIGGNIAVTCDDGTEYEIRNARFLLDDRENEFIYYESQNGRVFIDCNTLLMLGVTNSDSATVVLNAPGYNPVTVEEVWIYGVLNPETPDDVAVTVDDNGDMVITSGNKEWLEALCETYYHDETPYMKGGRLIFSLDGVSYDVYNTEEETFYYFDSDRVIFPAEMQHEKRMYYGTYNLVFLPYKYQMLSYEDSILLEGGLRYAPDDVGVVLEDKNIVISSDNERWLQILSENENSYIKLVNSTNEDEYYFDFDDISLSDGSIILSYDVLDNMGVENGPYTIYLYAYGYDGTYKDIVIRLSESPIVTVTQDEETGDLWISADDHQWLSEMHALKKSDEWEYIYISNESVPLSKYEYVSFEEENGEIIGFTISYVGLLANHVPSESSDMSFPETENYEGFSCSITNLHLNASKEAPEGLKVKETEEGIVFYFDDPGQEELDYLSSIVVASTYDGHSGDDYTKGSEIRIYTRSWSQSAYLSNQDRLFDGILDAHFVSIVLSDDGTYVCIPKETLMNYSGLHNSEEIYQINIEAYGYTMPEYQLELNGLHCAKEPIGDDFSITAVLDDEMNISIYSDNQEWIEAACKTEVYGDNGSAIEYGSTININNAETGENMYFNNRRYYQSSENSSDTPYELMTDPETGEKYIFIGNESLTISFGRRLEHTLNQKYCFSFEVFGYQDYYSDPSVDGEYVLFTEDLIKYAPSLIVSENENGDIVISTDDVSEEYLAYLNAIFENPKNYFVLDDLEEHIGYIFNISSFTSEQLYIKDDQLIIANQFLIDRRLKNKTYSLCFCMIGYEFISQDIALSKACDDAPNDIELLFNDNGDLEVHSQDHDWLYALSQNGISLYCDGLSKYISKERLVLLEDRVAVEAGVLRSLGLKDGLYTVYLNAAGYGQVRKYLSFIGYALEVTAEVFVSGETGDLIITCDDIDFINALTVPRVSEEREGIYREISNGGEISLRYPDNTGVYFDNSIHTNYDYGSTYEDTCITVEGNTAVISKSILLNRNDVYDSDDITVTLSAFGYVSFEVEHVSLHNVRKDYIPDDVAVTVEENGDITIWSSNRQWLQAICVNYDYSAQTGGRVSFETAHGNYTSWSSLVNSEYAKYISYDSEKGSVVISSYALKRNFVENGTCILYICPDGYRQLRYGEITVTGGVIDAPSDIAVSINADKDLVIASSDTDWLNALVGSTESYVWIDDYENTAYFGVGNASVIIKDGSAVIRKEELQGIGIPDGTYELTFNVFGYNNAYDVVQLSGYAAQRTAEVTVSQIDGSLVITCDDTDFLNGLVRESIPADEENPYRQIGGFVSIYNDSYGYSFQNRTYLEDETNKQESSLTLSGNTVVISEDTLLSKKVMNGEYTYVYIKAFGYERVMIDSITLNGLFQPEIPSDISVSLDEYGNVYIDSSDEDWLQALCEEYTHEETPSMKGGKIVLIAEDDTGYELVNTAEHHNYSYENGRIVFTAESQLANRLYNGTYSIHLNAYKYQPISYETPVALTGAYRYAPTDVTVSFDEENGIVIASANSEWRHILSNHEQSYVKLQNAETEQEYVFSYDQITVENDTLVLAKETLLQKGVSNGTYTVYMYAYGYDGTYKNNIEIAIEEEEPFLTAVQDPDTHDLVITSIDQNWINEMFNVKYVGNRSEVIWIDYADGTSTWMAFSGMYPTVKFKEGDEGYNALLISYEYGLLSYNIRSDVKTLRFPESGEYDSKSVNLDFDLIASKKIPAGLKSEETQEGIRFYFDNPGEEELAFLKNMTYANLTDRSIGAFDYYTHGSSVYIHSKTDRDHFYTASNTDIYNSAGEQTAHRVEITLSDDGCSVYVPHDVINCRLSTVINSEILDYSLQLDVYGYERDFDSYSLHGLRYAKEPLKDDFTVNGHFDDNLNLVVESNDPDWLEGLAKADDGDQYAMALWTQDDRFTGFHSSDMSIETDVASGNKYVLISRANVLEAFRKLNSTIRYGEKYRFEFFVYGHENYAGSADKEGEYIAFQEGYEVEIEDLTPVISSSYSDVLPIGESIDFTASIKADEKYISSWSWDFGDESYAVGKSVDHTFGEAGDYTVLVTVTDSFGRQFTSSKAFKVIDVNEENSEYTLVTFNVLNSIDATTISGAEISIVGSGEDAEIIKVISDENGNAQVILKNDTYTVSSRADGFIVRSFSIKVSGGQLEQMISMCTQSIMSGEITVREMTYEEIIEAGIDINAPGNQHVYVFTTTMTFTAGLKTYQFNYDTIKNENGNNVGAKAGPIREFIWPDGEDDDDDDENDKEGAIIVTVYPISEKFAMVVFGEAHWLKEMFEVALVVNNDSATDTLEETTAVLSLPEGMSFADMVSGEQSYTSDLGTIDPKGSKNAIWYIRGDNEGDYKISAHVTAKDMPYGDLIEEEFETTDPVHVYAGSALHLTITCDDVVERGKPYKVVYRLENVSDRLIYNLSFGLTESEQYKVIGYTDHSEEYREITGYDFGDAFIRYTPELAPGGYIEMELLTTTWFLSQAEYVKFSKLGNYIDISYYLKDISITEMSGSTTTIPYSIVVNETEKDYFVDWLVDTSTEELIGDYLPGGSIGGALVQNLSDNNVVAWMLGKAKTWLSLQQGSTDYVLTVTINDGKQNEDSIQNDYVRIRSSTPWQDLVDQLNGTTFKLTAREISIQAVGPGDTQITIGIENSFGELQSEVTLDIIIADQEIKDVLTLDTDGAKNEFMVNENKMIASTNKVKEDTIEALKQNPFLWIESTVAYDLNEVESDSNDGYTVRYFNGEHSGGGVLWTKTHNHIEINGTTASLDFTREAWQKIAEESGEEFTIAARRLSDEEAEQFNVSGPVYQFKAESGDTAISNLDGCVYVTVPYELGDPDNADRIYVEHFKANGTSEMILATYNAEDGTVSFETDSFSYFAIHEGEPEIRTLTLDQDTLELTIGEKQQLNVLEDINVIWTSADENIAAVDENGMVTAISAGETIITVKAKDDPELSAICEVTVLKAEDPWGDILPEDRPENPKDIPDGFWISDPVYDENDPNKPIVYTGSAITVHFRVYNNNVLLSENTDYTVKYANNTKAGIATVTITGKGNYVGTLTKEFEILPAEMNYDNTMIILNKDTFISNGKVQKPTVSVEYNGVKLKVKTDYILTLEESVKPGEYLAIVEGVGNFKGEVYTSYCIIVNDAEDPLVLVSALKITGIKPLTYNGEEQYQNITVKNGTKTLEEDEDYYVEYFNNIYAGTAYMVITGNEGNGYTGSITKSFKINPLKLTANNVEVLGLDAEYEYEREPIMPDPIVEHDGETLFLNEDYTVTYKNNNKAGSAVITFTGINNYKGSFSKTFKINKITLDESMFDFDGSYPYEKGGCKPIPMTDLTYNVDYTLSYTNNAKLTEATVTVKGKGSYVGTLKYNFDVISKDLGDVKLTALDKVYANKVNAWTSNATLTDTNGKKLAAGTDYEKAVIYTYADDTKVVDGSDKTKPELQRLAGEEVNKNDILPIGAVINITATGKGNYEGETYGSYRIVKADVAKATVTIPVQYFTGKPIELSAADIKVKIGQEILDPSCYEIVPDSYVNNTAKGTAKVTIRGLGEYGGSKTVSFTIKQRSLGVTIRFYGNGATAGNMNDQIIYKDIALTANAFKRIETVDGVKKTYVFKGWSLEPDGPVVYINKQVYSYSRLLAGSMVELYAVWE